MDDQNVLHEKIKEWKKAHKGAPRDLDFAFFCEILRFVNGSSPVKVACNPTSQAGEWVPGTECRSVAKAEVDDKGRLVLRLKSDKTGLSADKLYEQVQHLKKRVAGGKSPVMVKISETKTIQITDAYSHSLVKQHWAGLPFDLVFAYYDEEKRVEKLSPEAADETEGDGNEDA